MWITPYLQWYPLNLYLTNNVEDIKLSISDRNMRISHWFLITQGLEGCESKSHFLKGLFAKNKRFWSLLILLVYVAPMRWKLLKRLMPKNLASMQIQKVTAFNPDHKKYKFKSKQIIEILQPIIIDNFSTHSYIIDISEYLLFFYYQITISYFWVTFDNEDNIFIFSRNVRNSSTSEILF